MTWQQAAAQLPSPVTLEEKYLAKIAGMAVNLPAPVPLKHKFLAKIAGMQVDVPTYTTGLPRIYAYLAKAAGQDVEIPQPVTREEMYWFDYCGGTPTPPEREYTGAVPVTFVADGTPLLDLLISGNEEHSGTPTPDNPIMPEGTGERTGNLAKYWKPAYITANGLVNANRINGVSFPVKLEASQTVSFTNQKANFGRGIAVFSEFDGETLTNMIYRSTNNTVTYTADSDCYVIIWGNHDNTTSMDETVFNLCGQMLNEGSIPLPYEPYGYKIPISSASTTTPVYLGEVETTRRIGKIDLGTLNWSKTQSGNFLSDTFIEGMKAVSNIQKDNAISDMFTEVAPERVASTPYSFSSCLNNQQRPFVNSTGFENMSGAEFKEAMSGVYIWYVLATEETAVVNEPLMRIGEYADTLSMEQAGVQIPTANGSTTLDVETTVKPSEVYIKYRGEAVATLSTLSAEVSSPEATTEEETPEEGNIEETEEEENGSEDISLHHEFEAIE